MSLLAIAAGLVVLITAWFLVRPLRRAPAPSPTMPGQQELRVMRDRLLRQLDELEGERHNERIDLTAAQEEQRRLEAALAEVLKSLETVPPAPSPTRLAARTGLTGAALALLLPGATGLYLWQHHETLTRAIEAPAAVEMPPMVLEMVARLEKRLQQEPNNARGWAQLGRAYKVLNRPADATAAYAKAHKLAPADAEVLSDYAWLLYERGDPAQPNAETVALYQKLHRMRPEHQPALWVLGIAAYNANKPQQALVLWQKLLTLLPPDSPVAESVRHAVQGLQAK